MANIYELQIAHKIVDIKFTIRKRKETRKNLEIQITYTKTTATETVKMFYEYSTRSMWK